MPGSCVGFNPTDTAMCEACHGEGGMWVVRPDGSVICSKAWPEGVAAGPSNARKALAFAGGLALVLVGNALWKQYGGRKG